MQKLSVFVVAMVMMAATMTSCQSMGGGKALVSSVPSADQKGVHHASPQVLKYNEDGVVQVQSGQYKAGLENLYRALSLDPKNPDVMVNLVDTYAVFPEESRQVRGWSGQQIWEESLRLSKLAVKSQPEDFSLWKSYGQLYFYAEDKFGVEPDWNRAAKVWEDAREHAKRNDETFFAWLNEARAHIRAEQPQKAALCLEEALKLEPDSLVVASLLAKVQGEV